MGIILDGFKVAKDIRSKITLETAQLVRDGYRAPRLTVVCVGEDPASLTYVASKEKQAIQVGFTSQVIYKDATCSQDELVALIQSLNKDTGVDGILVQLPLPRHINEDVIISLIDPNKDVDGLTPHNVAMLALGKNGFSPCTPKGIMTLLKEYNITLEGKRVLIIGRSRLVGKPLFNLMLAQNATVTLAHSKTINLDDEIANHDVIVVAIGQREFIKASSIKPNHVLVDVGIHHNDEGNIVGDVEAAAYLNAAYASPVPRGVGPMTIASLLDNTLIAYKRSVEL